MSDSELQQTIAASYIIIKWSDDGELEIDTGSVNHYEAIGVLHACLLELEDRLPEIRVLIEGEDVDMEMGDGEDG